MGRQFVFVFVGGAYGPHGVAVYGRGSVDAHPHHGQCHVFVHEDEVLHKEEEQEPQIRGGPDV